MGTTPIPPEGDANAGTAAIRPRPIEISRLTPADPKYPKGLRDLAPPPRIVFAVGPWNLGNWSVAIVGARQATGDGCDFAEQLAAELAARGATILSGLAKGIDAAAHRGALGAGGLTGAVLGTSLEVCYPKEHAELQQAVAGSLGLLTEVPPGRPATRATFALRNRMLAALAKVVVVVQGDGESGALLTARAAGRLGRPVAAVPWDPRERFAEAPLLLLKEEGAVLVRHADDVFALMGGSVGAKRAPKSTSLPGWDSPLEDEADGTPEAELSGGARLSHAELLYGALRSLPQPLEAAARRAGLGIAEAGAALAVLELSGRARREPGGRVRRLAG